MNTELLEGAGSVAEERRYDKDLIPDNSQQSPMDFGYCSWYVLIILPWSVVPALKNPIV
jgi:hypothetical protein